MEYIVTVKQGSDELSFKFTDSIRANMFAEMAAKTILPATYYGEIKHKKVEVTILFVPVKAEAKAEEPDAEKTNDEEDE